MKKLTNAVSLCALMWAGSAHAGFIGTNVNFEFQYTNGSGTHTTDSTSVSVTGSPATTDLDGITFTINESSDSAASIDFTTTTLWADDIALTISYDNTVTSDEIIDASVMSETPTLAGFDANSISLTNLSEYSKSTVDVSFGLLSSDLFVSDALIQQDQTTQKVPEPMSLDLMALGLIMLGMMVHQRRHVRI